MQPQYDGRAWNVRALLESTATPFTIADYGPRAAIFRQGGPQASLHREAARSALRAVEARLNSLGRQADPKPLELAMAKIDEAQRMAGQLNQDASWRRPRRTAINDVLDTTVKRYAQLERRHRPMVCHSEKEKDGAT